MEPQIANEVTRFVTEQFKRLLRSFGPLLLSMVFLIVVLVLSGLATYFEASPAGFSLSVEVRKK